MQRTHAFPIDHSHESRAPRANEKLIGVSNPTRTISIVSRPIYVFGGAISTYAPLIVLPQQQRTVTPPPDDLPGIMLDRGGKDITLARELARERAGHDLFAEASYRIGQRVEHGGVSNDPGWSSVGFPPCPRLQVEPRWL